MIRELCPGPTASPVFGGKARISEGHVCPCHTPHQGQSLDRDPGFLAASPSHFTAVIQHMLLPPPGLPFALSSTKPPRDLLRTSRSSRMSPLSPRRLLQWPRRLPWWQSMSCCCVFLALSFSVYCPHTRPVQILEKNSALSRRGRHLLQKINNAEEMLSVLTVTTRVQAGNQNPAQMVLGIQTKRPFTELGDRLKETGKGY